MRGDDDSLRLLRCGRVVLPQFVVVGVSGHDASRVGRDRGCARDGYQGRHFNLTTGQAKANSSTQSRPPESPDAPSAKQDVWKLRNELTNIADLVGRGDERERRRTDRTGVTLEGRAQHRG